MPDAPPPESADSDAQAEQLAVLNLQLEYAMQRRELVSAQTAARSLVRLHLTRPVLAGSTL